MNRFILSVNIVFTKQTDRLTYIIYNCFYSTIIVKGCDSMRNVVLWNAKYCSLILYLRRALDRSWKLGAFPMMALLQRWWRWQRRQRRPNFLMLVKCSVGQQHWAVVVVGCQDRAAKAFCVSVCMCVFMYVCLSITITTIIVIVIVVVVIAVVDVVVVIYVTLCATRKCCTQSVTVSTPENSEQLDHCLFQSYLWECPLSHCPSIHPSTTHHHPPPPPLSSPFSTIATIKVDLRECIIILECQANAPFSVLLHKTSLPK